MEILFRRWRMKTSLWGSSLEVPDREVPVALTMGVFDGFHRGHRTLVERICREPGTLPMVVTFSRNPKKVLSKENYTGDLMTLEDKLEAFRSLGVRHTLIIDFSTEFSRMSGREFFHQLNQLVNIRSMVVGYDFSFGSGAATKAGDLEPLLKDSTTLSIMPPVYEGGAIISSTLIRTCLKEGDMARAVRLLGHSYVADYTGSPPRGESGFWQARRDDFLQLMPGDGRYSARGDGVEVELAVDGDLITWRQEGPASRKFIFS